MQSNRNRRRAVISWLYVGSLFALCGLLGFLQYRWLGEVSVAERERMRSGLQANLNRLSREFNSEITSMCLSLLPPSGQERPALEEKHLAARYALWRRSSRNARLIGRLALASSGAKGVALKGLDLEKAEFHPMAWPAEWKRIRQRIEARLRPEPWREPGPPGPPESPEDDDVLVLAAGRFLPPGPGFGPERFGPPEMQWLIVDLGKAYVRETFLPELLQHHLGVDGALDYQVEVTSRASSAPLFEWNPDHASRIGTNADASVPLLQIQYEQVFRWRGVEQLRQRVGAPPAFGEGGPPRAPALGRWRMAVRHRAGSLEAVVARTRQRNLAVTGGVLLLIAASAAALLRYTRRAQRLAGLQMDFVAGVSHELRTPLTVIHTAAYNLRGKVALNPIQVERYGELIQKESARLTRLVEDVLRFAGTKAGHVLGRTDRLAVGAVIERALEASKAALEESGCVVETSIAKELPPVMGDATALQHAIQNLLGNAAKYGRDENDWIGVSAAATGENGLQTVEIRVADHGAGIPAAERDKVFDPFFRGARAIADQIHGTGLGLSLVREIVEAHGGAVTLESGRERGCVFVVRIPAAPPEVAE